MPGKGLQYGSAISKGANAFLQSFMAAKQFEHQEKQQKNKVAIEAIMSQIQDENTPMSKRAALLDEVQRLANDGKPVKDDERLSIHLGLTPDSPLMQEEINTGERQNVQIGGDSNNILNEAPPIMNASMPVLKRRGDLSPRDLAVIQKRFQDLSEEAKQERLMRVQADIQESSYKKLSYNKIDEGKDSNGNRYIILQNNAGDVKILNLNTSKEIKSLPSDFTSEKESIASLRGSGLPSTIKGWEQYYLTQNDPETNQLYSPEVAHKLALQKYAEIGNSMIQGRETTNLIGQQNAGLAPKPQTDEDLRAEDSQIESILDKANNALADFNETSSALRALQRKKDELFRIKDEKQAALNELLKEEYDETSKNQVTAISKAREELSKAVIDANNADADFGIMEAKAKRAKAETERVANQAKNGPYSNKLKVIDRGDGVFVIDRIENSEEVPSRIGEGRTQTPNNSSATRDATTLLANPKVQEKIKEIRDKKSQTKNMSDEEILSLMISQGIVSAPPRQ